VRVLSRQRKFRELSNQEMIADMGGRLVAGRETLCSQSSCRNRQIRRYGLGNRDFDIIEIHYRLPLRVQNAEIEKSGFCIPYGVCKGEFSKDAFAILRYSKVLLSV
jgi:hypothetical protein